MKCATCGREICPPDEAQLCTGYADNVQLVISCECGQEYEGWVEYWMPLERADKDGQTTTSEEESDDAEA